MSLLYFHVGYKHPLSILKLAKISDAKCFEEKGTERAQGKGFEGRITTV